MNRIEISRDIRTFLIDNFLFGRAEDLPEDQPLQGNIVDSTGAMELVLFLQDHFAITVEDDEVIPENIDSVKNLVAYVAKKLGSNT